MFLTQLLSFCYACYILPEPLFMIFYAFFASCNNCCFFVCPVSSLMFCVLFRHRFGCLLSLFYDHFLPSILLWSSSCHVLLDFSFVCVVFFWCFCVYASFVVCACLIYSAHDLFYIIS